MWSEDQRLKTVELKNKYLKKWGKSKKETKTIEQMENLKFDFYKNSKTIPVPTECLNVKL